MNRELGNAAPTTPDQVDLPWHYFVVYRTNDGFTSNIRHDLAEEITHFGQVAEIEQAIAAHLGSRRVTVTVTSYQLLTGPPRNILIDWETDDIVTATIDGELIGTYTHDEQGTAGIQAALTAINKLAVKLGLTVTVLGDQGV
jgi:hypothetical protein